MPGKCYRRRRRSRSRSPRRRSCSPRRSYSPRRRSRRMSPHARAMKAASPFVQSRKCELKRQYPQLSWGDAQRAAFGEISAEIRAARQGMACPGGMGRMLGMRRAFPAFPGLVARRRAELEGLRGRLPMPSGPGRVDFPPGVFRPPSPLNEQEQPVLGPPFL